VQKHSLVNYWIFYFFFFFFKGRKKIYLPHAVLKICVDEKLTYMIFPKLCGSPSILIFAVDNVSLAAVTHKKEFTLPRLACALYWWHTAVRRAPAASVYEKNDLCNSIHLHWPSWRRSCTLHSTKRRLRYVEFVEVFSADLNASAISVTTHNKSSDLIFTCFKCHLLSCFALWLHCSQHKRKFRFFLSDLETFCLNPRLRDLGRSARFVTVGRQLNDY